VSDDLEVKVKCQDYTASQFSCDYSALSHYTDKLCDSGMCYFVVAHWAELFVTKDKNRYWYLIYSTVISFAGGYSLTGVY